MPIINVFVDERNASSGRFKNLANDVINNNSTLNLSFWDKKFGTAPPDSGQLADNLN